MRSLPLYLLMFAAGVFCAGVWFYELHPEHSPKADIPRVHREVRDAVERARQLQETWDQCTGTPTGGSEGKEQSTQPTDTHDAEIQHSLGKNSERK